MAHKASNLCPTDTVASVSPTLSPALSPALGNTMNTVANSNDLRSGAFTGTAALAANDATQSNLNNLQTNAVNRKDFANRTKDALLDPLGKPLGSRTFSAIVKFAVNANVNNVSKKRQQIHRRHFCVRLAVRHPSCDPPRGRSR